MNNGIIKIALQPPPHPPPELPDLYELFELPECLEYEEWYDDPEER